MSYKTLKVLENLVLICDTKIENTREIKRNLTEAYQTNKKFFNSDTPTIAVTFVYKRTDLEKIVHHQTKDWEVAYAYNNDELKNQIVIFSPEVIETVSRNTKSYFPYLLTHEMAHIFTNNVCIFLNPDGYMKAWLGLWPNNTQKSKKYQNL